jgi:hypothetical protein
MPSKYQVHIYELIKQLCRPQVEFIWNQKNKIIAKAAQVRDQSRRYKRLKLREG